MSDDVYLKTWYVTIRAEVVASGQEEAARKGIGRILPLRSRERLLIEELAKAYPNYQWYMEEGPRFKMPPNEFVRVFIEKGYVSDGNQRRSCPKCGYPNIFDNPFCNACGADTLERPCPPPPRYRCSKCGYTNDARNYHCDKCGILLRKIDEPLPTIDDLWKTWYVNMYAAVVTLDKKDAARKGLERIFSFVESEGLVEALAKVYPNYEFLTREGSSFNMPSNEFVKAYIVTYGVPEQTRNEEIECPNCSAKNNKKYKYCYKCGVILGEVLPPPPARGAIVGLEGEGGSNTDYPSYSMSVTNEDKMK